MALTTHNITGSLKDSLGGTGLVGEVTFTPFGTHDARVDGADALLGPIRYSIADVPASLPLSAGGWVISIRSTGRVNGDQQFKTITRTLELTGPETWGDIVAGAVSSPPMTPTLVEEAQAAATSAEADALAAQTAATEAAAFGGTNNEQVAGMVTAAGPTKDALSATYVARPSLSLDLCAAPYNVSPGEDITAALQDAIGAIVTTGQSGEVVVSKIGTYLIDGAQRTGAALGYNYSGQVLFPAVNFDGVPGLAITIRGPVRPTSGVATTGQPQGVVFQSSTTTGYVFDTVPSQEMWGWKWTGVMPVFKDIIIRVPDNPTCGGVNLECALRCMFDGVSVDTTGAWTFPTGTREAIVLPHWYNNGDVALRDVNVRGFPVGVKISEHNVLDNVNIIGCAAAFSSIGGGHSNWFGYVDVEECPVVFKLDTGPAVVVNGFLDIENVKTTGPFAANVLVDGTGFIYGKLDIGIAGAANYSMGIKGGGIARGLDLANIGHGLGVSWRGLHPEDTFQRLENVAVTGTAAPGQAHPTLHPWRTVNGSWSVSAGALIGTGATNAAFVPALNGGETRSVSATVALDANPSYHAQVVACRPYDTDYSIWARLTDGDLRFGVGSGGGAATTIAPGIASPGNTYTVTIEVHYEQNSPHMVRVYLDGELKHTRGLTATEKASLARSGTFPYMEDGLRTADSTSKFTHFVVKPLSPPVPYVRASTATLAAGSATVSDSRIAASSIVRLHRQAAGGTLGDLSVAVSPGVGFTINSSSNLEASTVYYEVVNY